MNIHNPSKIVLAYSGGLDTSVILKWLQEKYQCEVITFTADIGQGEEVEPARKKAQNLGVKKIYIENLENTFVKDYVFPMFRCNTIYEGMYLLGTSIARPLIAKRQIEIAKFEGADAVAHGATGKGNDQVRFELSYLAQDPDIKVIAPWREWELSSRTKLIEYAEGKILEDPWIEPEEYIYSRTVNPMEAPDKPTEITIEFSKGDPIALNQKKLEPAQILKKLNEFGGKNGIGRIDIVENRFVGIKSRGVYETPGGTILLYARRAIESITLDREEAHLKDEIMPKYAKLIYNGFWFSPEREMMQALIDKASMSVNGVVRLKLYKGNIIITGRKSENSLYDESLVTFEDSNSNYDQTDAKGFIKLNALRLIKNKKI